MVSGNIKLSNIMNNAMILKLFNRDVVISHLNFNSKKVCEFDSLP